VLARLLSFSGRISYCPPNGPRISCGDFSA
jgi:hypothetical protein